MKPFKINRNTWHYKLNQKFMNDDGLSDYMMQNYWEYKHRDFCSYWRATIGRVLFLSLLTAVCIILLIGLVNTIYLYPLAMLKGVGVGICIIAAIVGLIVVSEELKSRKKNQPEGLVAQRYRAYKSKVCPMVEYEE